MVDYRQYPVAIALGHSERFEHHGGDADRRTNADGNCQDSIQVFQK
jgi:hypothetical protein